MIGKTISHYKLLEKIGEGGMGVVYKAEDVRLRRLVALKFLPPHATANEEDRARFLREAQAAAALDHPNICTVYEIDEFDGAAFMAMAFLEGETLDKKLEQAPLPIEQAVGIARQAAEGLAAAHRKGVVHRDIKAANLMIAGPSARPTVKILDFGLAQLAGRSKLTQLESRLGTVAYMSPEQTQGQEVDGRTDIWALGVVLYQGVAGELPFQGHYDQAILYSILNEDPEPLTAKRARVPMELDWIVAKCLAKDPAGRYQRAEELIIDLSALLKKLEQGKSSIQTGVVSLTTAAPLTPASAGGASREADLAAGLRRLKWTALALTVCLFAALAGLLAVRGRPGPEAEERLVRFSIDPRPALSGAAALRGVQVSPDGRHVAFTTTGSEGKLWVRDLDQTALRALEGTERASRVFWSPDSAFLGYYDGRALRKIPVHGGPSRLIANVGGELAGSPSWSEAGSTIVFTAGSPPELMEVAASGGTPRLIDLPPREGARRKGPGPGWRGSFFDSRLLENSAGERLLLSGSPSRNNPQILLRNLDSGRLEMLVEGSFPAYAPSGHLLYREAGSDDIWAAALSLESMELVGEPFPVAAGGVAPSVSAEGTLVYLDSGLSGPRRLVWRDRSGEIVRALGRTHLEMRFPAVSPDGSRVAVSASGGDQADIWIHENQRGVHTRLTFEEANERYPVWSGDGRRILYGRFGRGVGEGALLAKAVDGSGPAETLISSAGFLQPLDWSPNGRVILLRTFQRGGLGGLSYAVRGKDSEYAIRPFVEGPFRAAEARLSPDGRWVAYESNETEEFEIYVRPFPEGSGRWQLSSRGGRQPRWSPEGDEIFYVEGSTLLAVPVETRNGFSWGEPEALFESPALEGGPRAPGYDVSPDGEQFVLVEPAEQAGPPLIRVTLNWLAAAPR